MVSNPHMAAHQVFWTVLVLLQNVDVNVEKAQATKIYKNKSFRVPAFTKIKQNPLHMDNSWQLIPNQKHMMAFQQVFFRELNLILQGYP